jgi:AhpD family alkylhydroperoxidase
MTDMLPRPRTPGTSAPGIKPSPRARRAPEELRRVIFTNRALDSKTKQLIAVGAAHLTQCPYCIDGHTGLAERAGATPQEITETIWVASEIRAGGTFPHPARGPHSHPDPTPPRQNRDDWSH